MSRIMQNLHGDGKSIKKHGLGRGLDALIKENPAAPAVQTHEAAVTAAPTVHPAGGHGNRNVPIESIKANPWQPRRTFEKESLDELTESIRQHGILQPLLVRKVGDEYELIAGERRFRAAKDAGLTEVPVTIKDAVDSNSLLMALVENLHRDDLGILEEATAYQMLADKFTMTQEQIAERMGKARASVTNTMRILGLPEEVRNFIASGQLTAGHAKVLAGVEIEKEQIILAKRAVSEDLSVRAFEKLVEKTAGKPRKPRGIRDDVPASHIKYLSDKLHARFGTSVRLFSSRTYANGKKGRGTIEIDYFSSEDLDRILGLLGITENEVR